MRQLLVLALIVGFVAATSTARGQAAATAPNAGRILGVLDAESGAPIEGAEVIDRIANVSATTGKSGLVALGTFKSQHDSSVVTVRKVGYRDTTFLAMQSDTTPITLMLDAAPPVLPPLLSKAMVTKSDLEETARYTDALFIPPGILRSPTFKGKSLGDALRAFNMIGQFPSKYDTKPDELPRNPDAPNPGGHPGSTQCLVQIVWNYDKAAGNDVKLEDDAAIFDGALFYPKGRPLPEEFQKYAGCGGTLFLWSIAK